MSVRVTVSGPRLAPHAVILRRTAGELQIGVDPSVVVPTAYEPVVRALAAGDPVVELDRVGATQGLDPEAVGDLLRALDGARLLRPAAAPVANGVRVVGAGPLGARVAHALAAAGFGTLYLVDLPERAGPLTRTTPPGTPDRVDLLAAALSNAAPGVRVRRSRHFVKPEGAAVALTVVVADGPEPDRLVTDLLREHQAPHLLVRSGGDEAVVGPLVVPGTTCCVRCTDLDRRDADPRWPWLLDQLTRVHLEPTPALLAWAAATAVVQTLAYVGGGRPETLGHTLELGVDQHALRLRSWTSHPECVCRWSDPVATDVALSG